jgi:hypothetical protein
VTGCIARRLKCMAVRSKLDQGSTRWLCGCIDKTAIPRQACTLRRAVRADQEKQA